MLYRIFAEDKGTDGRKQVADIVSAQFQGFAVYQSQGYWNGQPENFLVVEVDLFGDEAGERKSVHAVAAKIRSALDQECVMVQALKVSVEFI